MPTAPIRSIPDLHEHLQRAIELEHATIPAYLTVLYTIRPGTNREAGFVIRSVVVQEMLHLTLAANVLNAVGGEPAIDKPGFVPAYPMRLPYTDVEVSLRPFSRDAVEMCAAIEHPGPGHDGEPQHGDVYGTVEQFYEAILEGLDWLVATLGAGAVFTGDPARQVGAEAYYGAAGPVRRVTDPDSARAAIRTIVDQGEGLPRSVFDENPDFATGHEIAHFYRFRELLVGRWFRKGDEPHPGPTGPVLPVDWDAGYPTPVDPKLDDYPPGSDVRRYAEQFDAAYADLLGQLHKAFNGQPEEFGPATLAMLRLRDRALALVRNPIPGRPGVHAAPTYQIP